MLNINITTIPQRCMDYDTLGDYKGHMRRRFIEIAELNDPRWEFLIGYHEMIEQQLALALGISEESIMVWDKEHPDADDPGSLPDCPYGTIHLFAERHEKELCEACGWSWEEYNAALDRHIDKSWPKDPYIKTGGLA